MTDFLKKKKIKITYFEKEQKNILDNILNWSIEKIKKKVNQLHTKINKRIIIFEIKLHQNSLSKNESRQRIRQRINKSFSDLDILLVMCPPWDTKKPPLNLAYLVTYLKSKGIKADIFDLNIIFYNSVSKKERVYWEMENIWQNLTSGSNILKKNNKLIDKFMSIIIEEKIKIIGFSVNQGNLLFTLKIANKIKKENKNVKIIFGGTAIFYEESRNKIPGGVCDYFVIGEGEETLYELTTTLKEGKSFNSIKGVMVNKKYDKCKFVPRQPIINLNKIPFPTFEEFDLKLYTNKELPILISRGCIGKCAYCTDYIISGFYRYKSAEKIIEELKYLTKKYKIKMFALNDLLCNANLKELEKICDLIIKSNLKINWGGYATIRKDMSFKLLKKIKRAGCVALHYGFESGSNKVLKLMNKCYTVEDAEELIKRTKKAGMMVVINIIVGFPGETDNDFNETIEFIKKNKSYIDSVGNVSICFLMVGSMIYKHYPKYGITLTNNLDNWYDKYNNHKIRAKKAEYVIKLLNKLKIPLSVENLYQEDVVYKIYKIKKLVR